MRGALQSGSALTTLAPASRRHGSIAMIALVHLLIIHAATGVAPSANRAPQRSSPCSTITSTAPVATARRAVLAGTLATLATPYAAGASDYAKAFAASTKLDAANALA